MNSYPTMVRRVGQGQVTFPPLKLTVADGVHNALSCAPQSILTHKTAPGSGSSGRRTEPSSARSPTMDNPPNNNIHTIVRAQIVFLLSTLTEDNFDRNQAEIRSVCPLTFQVASPLISVLCIRSYLSNMGSKHTYILSDV
jgi:hypothetical protein